MGDGQRRSNASVERELARIVDDARAAVAAGTDPGLPELQRRVRALAGEPRATEQALQALARIGAVVRARALVEEPLATPAPPAPTRPPRRAALRTRPTLTANMDVRRERQGDAFALAWDTAPAIASWEVRFSERPDARAEYSVLETRSLAGETTRVELPLGERLLRVHLLGRSRDGRLLRRAVISGLGVGNWDDAWQRRASAS